MLLERPKPERSGVIVPTVALATLAVLALAGLSVAPSTSPGLEELGTSAASHRPSLADRLAAVDRAIVRGDVAGATRAWREAYLRELGTQDWHAMITLGDAAAKWDAVLGRPAGQPTAFRPEARQAYLRALFFARASGSREGIARVAEAFGALGDSEVAARVRAIAEKR